MAQPTRSMNPEVRTSGASGNADATMPVKAVRQALEELSSNSTWIATAMTQALVAVTLESGRTGCPSAGLPIPEHDQSPA
jgi:hypothetical protein